MTLNYQKKEEWFKFLDSQGNPIERRTEIRFDPITGESSRLIYDSGLVFTPPDYTEIAKKNGGAKCPFCQENLLKMTPIFPKEINENGRIIKGEAVGFPNLFPYSKHNGVVIFSGQHYVRLEEFTIELITNAFSAAQDYLKRIITSDPEARYISINWNYLPYSGGSVLHPHIQVCASDSPTNYQAQLEAKTKAYEGNNDLFTNLYETEKAKGERWIGEKGNVAWMHAYAPKGQNDFVAIFPEKYTINDLTEQDWTDFAAGLKAIFQTLTEQGFASFNMALNFSLNEDLKQAVHVRLIPRFTVGMMETSDTNFYQALHQEPLTYKVPEEVASRAREYFNKIIE
ncbi:hypothetical protein RRV45_06175 [Bacillus sp. DTU_2020_1000418_1_SI_GHA_SEK_038]|uniref:hypothetical protein n=1 Tax=Bacillus sp. DTU_2020_1000418_1_SI_GHA_SEK_038 TaxID=3077585 RepID=UPI0028EE2E14|nr:hypothetical protein [Bacillus sp. DTU_2020_1000418_1_SI_GHA_SEK_038]WNS76591.1 hypothetical protein RRV45_06175 [Bacillus sp. DTU_2020_1000418_1_SI_GHA_SEK_038]